MVKTAFQWRLMALAGFQPFVDGCAVCGAEEPAAPMLDVVHGVVRCGGCKGGGGLSLPLTAAGLGGAAAYPHRRWEEAVQLHP